MVVESWPVERVTPYAKNPRRNDAAVDAVARSIQQYGFRQPIVVDKKGVVIVGHTRLKAAKQLGMTHVPVHVAKDLSASKASALRIADNKTNEIAEWDADLLNAEVRALAQLPDFKDIELGMSVEEVQAMIVDTEMPTEGSSSLRDRFVVPPFSVLDARAGYWQDRKRAWLAMGIKSELGRGAGVWVESSSGSPLDRQTNMKSSDSRAYKDHQWMKDKIGKVQAPLGKSSPGRSLRPAANYTKRQRGDGRGRPV